MKKTLMAALAATFLSGGIAEAAIYDKFVGANGNTRTITNTVTDGNITTFTVDTLRSNGTIKTRTFTATNIDSEFTISGNGKAAFKEFLSAHAMKAQNVGVDMALTDNEMAFNAYTRHFGIDLKYSDQNSNKDFIGLVESLNIDVDYDAPVDPYALGEAGESFAHSGTYSVFLQNDEGHHRWTSVSDYDMLAIDGLEAAHNEGWTGVDTQIAIVELVHDLSLIHI